MLAKINYKMNKIRIKLFFISTICFFSNLKINGQEKKHTDTDEKIKKLAELIITDTELISSDFNIYFIERIRPYLKDEHRSEINKIISKKKPIKEIISMYKKSFNAKEIDSIYKFIFNREHEIKISKKLKKRTNLIYSKANDIENNLEKYLYTIDSTNYKFNSIVKNKKSINGFYELTTNIDAIYEKVTISNLSKKPIIEFNKIVKIEFNINNHLCYYCYPITVFLNKRNITKLNQIIKNRNDIKLVLVINGEIVLDPIALKKITGNSFMISGNLMSYEKSKKIVDTFNNYH